jgi:Domain of unknown function (DUF1929)
MPWEVVSDDSQVLAIHAALLPTHEILYFGGDEHSQAQHNAGEIDNTRLFNIADGSIVVQRSPTTDIFCSGHAFLGDGRLLIGGGTEQWGAADPGHAHGLNFGGHRACWIYETDARAWSRAADMNFQPGRATGGGRWYPTLITLASGSVLAVFGHPSRSDTRHRNDTPEVYDPNSNVWALLPSIGEDVPDPLAGGPLLNYPRLHLLRSGRVFFATPMNTNRLYDPASGLFEDEPVISRPVESLYQGWFGTSVLLPLLPSDGYTPRVLICGDRQPYQINLGVDSPAWRNAGLRTGAAAGRVRQNFCAVILPTGDVFVSGGVSDPGDDRTAVLEGEIYSLGINWVTGEYIEGEETWTSTEPASVPRNYHSVALLMPNGRVWTAGSSKNADQGDPQVVGELRIEIYKPWYDGDPNRPQITDPTEPTSLDYGQTFEIRSPQAESIQRVALLRAGSVTHAFDADQRYVGVEFRYEGGDLLTVPAPPNGNIAPPGWYMLWIIDDASRPSATSTFMRIKPLKTSVRDVQDVAVAPLSDSRLELWAADAQNRLFTTWKIGVDPNANWAPWFNFLAEIGALPIGARQAAVAPLSDRRLELWVVDGQGGLWTTWKVGVDPNANWAPWFNFTEL